MNLLGFLAFTIVIIALSDEKQSANLAFSDFVNITGWNDGFAFTLGASQIIFSYSSVDSVKHTAECTSVISRLTSARDAKLRAGVPRAMGLTMIIGASTSTAFSIAMLFPTTSHAEVQQSAVTIFTIYTQATHTRIGVTVLATWFILIFLGAFGPARLLAAGLSRLSPLTMAYLTVTSLPRLTRHSEYPSFPQFLQVSSWSPTALSIVAR